MSNKKAGRRQTLLLYERMMDRLWRVTLPLGLLMLAWWYWGGSIFFAQLNPPIDIITLCCAIALIFFSFFFIVTRRMAYVQAREDHLRMVTPFINLKILLPACTQCPSGKLCPDFPHKETSWSQRRFLEPFYGKTALALELTKLPFSRGFLSLFFGPQTFLPTYHRASSSWWMIGWSSVRILTAASGIGGKIKRRFNPILDVYNEKKIRSY